MRTIARRGFPALILALVLLIADTLPATATQRATGAPADPAVTSRATGPSLVDLLTRWFSDLWSADALPADAPGPDGYRVLHAGSCSDSGDEPASPAGSASEQGSGGSTADPQRGSGLDPDG